MDDIKNNDTTFNFGFDQQPWHLVQLSTTTIAAGLFLSLSLWALCDMRFVQRRKTIFLVKFSSFAYYIMSQNWQLHSNTYWGFFLHSSKTTATSLCSSPCLLSLPCWKSWSFSLCTILYFSNQWSTGQMSARTMPWPGWSNMDVFCNLAFFWLQVRKFFHSMEDDLKISLHMLLISIGLLLILCQKERRLEWNFWDIGVI